jgi:hypothetical protein
MAVIEVEEALDSVFCQEGDLGHNLEIETLILSTGVVVKKDFLLKNS